MSRLAGFALLVLGGLAEGDNRGVKEDLIEVLRRGGEGEGRLQGVEKHGGPPVLAEVGRPPAKCKDDMGRQRECEGMAG